MRQPAAGKNPAFRSRAPISRDATPGAPLRLAWVSAAPLAQRLISAKMRGLKNSNMDHLLLLRVMVLLGIANGAPIIATRIFGARFGAPLDGGLTLRDGAPLFGDGKTIRGVVASVGCTAFAGSLMGFDWVLGAGFAAASLAGDLLSSFLKRRRRLEPHAEAFGVDQIPEALLPLVIFRTPLGLTALEIVVLLGAFVALASLLSQLLFRLNIRDRPY